MGKLEETFSYLAMIAPEATKVRLEENMIQVTGAAVYVGPVENDHQRACPNGKLVPYLPGKAKHKNITDVDHLRPEKLFKPESVKLPMDVLVQYVVEGMAGNLYITFGNIPGSGKFELLLMVAAEVEKKKIWRIIWRSEVPDYFKIAYKRFMLSKLEPRLCDANLSDEYEWKIQTSYRVKNPVLTVNNKTETLYHLLKYIKLPDALPDYIVDDEYSQVYCPDGWKDATQDFTKLIKAKQKEAKNIMSSLPKLPMPPNAGTVAKKEPDVPAVAPAEEPKAAPLPPVMPKPQETPAAPPPAPQVEPPAVKAPEPEAQEQPAAAPAEALAQEEAKPKRQRRVKQATTVGFDFSEVLEYLGNPVALNAADIPQALNEVRDLRDLQIAAARRMANIYSGLNELAGPALEKFGKIKDLLNN